jgi:chemotaxis protein MotB
MTESLNLPEYRCFNIKVEGHTDDIPIKTERFPSNWELSAARSSRVARFLIDEKLKDYRFKTIAFADTRPKVPNRDESGAPIKENQAKNQRIQMRVERMSLKEQARCNESDNLKDMLKNMG